MPRDKRRELATRHTRRQRDSWSAPAANRLQKPRRAPVPPQTAALSALRTAIPSRCRRACAWRSSAHLHARRAPRLSATFELTLPVSPLPAVLLHPRALLPLTRILAHVAWPSGLNYVVPRRAVSG